MFEMNSNWKITHRAVGVAASLLFIYLLVSMALLMIGRQPVNVQESIIAQRQDQLISLLRLDYLATPLYYLLFLGFFTALKRSNGLLALVTSILGFVGATIFLAMPSSFSWAILIGEFPSTNVDAQKTLFQAANEAIFASDLWQGTGALLGRLLIQVSFFSLSLIMLRSNNFGKETAWTGIITHGLDLLHILVGSLLPVSGFVLMLIAGPLSLVWFLFVARDFFQLGNESIVNRDYLALDSIS